MKKLFAILLTATLLLSVAVTPAFALNHKQGDWQFEEEFVDYHFPPEKKDSAEYEYEELYSMNYVYPDSSTAVGWVLVKCSLFDEEPEKIKQFLGDDRVLLSDSYSDLYPFGYAVYDAQRNTYVELRSLYYNEYERLEHAVEYLKIGHPIGDADFDGELSIFDVTYIQMVMAGLKEFNEYDDIREFVDIYHYEDLDRFDYISDFNRDGDRNIFDATAIQLKLVAANPDIIHQELLIQDFNLFDQNKEDFPVTEFGYDIDHELVYSQTFYNKTVNYSGEFIALVYNKEQYFELFNEYDPEYDDEFFKRNALVVTHAQCTDHYMTAPLNMIAVKDDTMYVEIKINYPPGDIGYPTAPYHLSIAKVDKDDVKKVTSIVYADVYMRDQVVFPVERDESIREGCEIGGYVDIKHLSGSKNVYCAISIPGGNMEFYGSENIVADDHLCKIWYATEETVYFAFDIPDSYNLEVGKQYHYIIYNEDGSILQTRWYTHQ